MADFLVVTDAGLYLEYEYNDYSPFVAIAEGTKLFPKQCRAKSYLTEIALVTVDITDTEGDLLFGGNTELVKVKENNRYSFAIGNTGDITDVMDGFQCVPNVYVIESVGGHATTTSADVYAQIKALLAT